MNKNRIISGLIFLFIAGICVAIFMAIDPNVITCDGKVMQPHDRCTHTDKVGRITEIKNYEEERSSQVLMKWIGLVTAIIFAPVGLLIIFTGSKKNSSSSSHPNSISQDD